MEERNRGPHGINVKLIRKASATLLLHGKILGKIMSQLCRCTLNFGALPDLFLQLDILILEIFLLFFKFAFCNNVVLMRW